MKIVLSVLLLVGALFVAAVVLLSKPKFLGVRYTDADLKSIYNKVNVKFEPLDQAKNGGKTLVVSGSHPVDTTFSSEELTAGADNRSRNYAYFPFRNLQIRINGDGSVEGSATVGFSDAVNYLVALGVSYSDIMKGAQKFKIPNATLPVYLKVKGAVENNQSNITVMGAEISRIPIPAGLVNRYGPQINDLVEQVIRERQPSYNIEKLEVAGGKVHFKGTAPDIEQAVKSL